MLLTTPTFLDPSRRVGGAKAKAKAEAAAAAAAATPPPPDTDGLPFSYLAEDGNSPGRQAGRAIGDAAAAELLRLYAPEGGGGAAAALPGGDDALPEEFLATSEPQAAAVHGFVPPIAT